jgi:Tol biopolymer transport system component
LLVKYETGREDVLVTRSAGDLGSLAWSPDGRLIAYVITGRDGKGSYYDNVEVVDVEARASSTVSRALWRRVNSLAWQGDGRGLFVTGRGAGSNAGEPNRVWYLPYPEGPPQKITKEQGDYLSVSLTADSHTMLAVRHDRLTVISLLNSNGSVAFQHSLRNFNVGHFAWAPDGRRIIYDAEAGGGYALREMSPEGGPGRQLTSGPDHEAAAAVSPDGRYIVYRSDHTPDPTPARPDDQGGASLKRMDAGGGNSVPLASVDSAFAIQVSRDSRWVYYTSADGAGAFSLWRVSIDGGVPEKLSDGSGEYHLSPDGSQFVAFERAPGPRAPNSPRHLITFPADGGPVNKYDAPPEMGDVMDWAPDGRAVDYVVTSGGESSVWRLPLSRGARPTRLTRLKGDGQVSGLAWSHNGRLLAVVRDASSTDLVLIKDVASPAPGGAMNRPANQ